MTEHEEHMRQQLIQVNTDYQLCLTDIQSFIPAWFHSNRHNDVMFSDFQDSATNLEVSHYDNTTAYIRAYYWDHDESYQMPLEFVYNAEFRNKIEHECIVELEKHKTTHR